MARAKYSYALKEDVKMVVIIDQNGPMSLTNDIENVIEEICDAKSISPPEWGFLYQDSTNMWDGFDPLQGTFIDIQTKDRDHAILEMLRYRENSQIGGCCGGGCHCG